MAPNKKLEDAISLIDDLKSAPEAYKVDVDLAKLRLSRAYEIESNKISEQFTHAGKYLELSSEEREIDVPYDLRGLFSKKLDKALKAAPDTPYIQAIRDLRDKLTDPHEDLKNLIANQVKGRKPDTREREVIGTKKQMRADCACCFKQHAVKGDTLVNHGYDLKLGFQNDTCNGAGRPHFGTPEGRDLAAGWAQQFKELAAKAEKRAAGVLSGDQDTYERVRRNGNWIMAKVENPESYQRRQFANQLKSEAKAYLRAAENYDQAVQNWQPKEPVEVTVEQTRVVEDTPSASGPKL